MCGYDINIIFFDENYEEGVRFGHQKNEQCPPNFANKT